MKFETNYHSLKNGVRVLTIPMSGVESLASLVLVRTGSRNESPEIAGISHVLEHMLFKGTKKYRTSLSLASAVDALGAEYNAYTAKEYTGYYIHADARHAGRAIEILGEMVTSPLLMEEELKREQGVIIEEINMYEDLPMERAEEEVENLLYMGNPLGRLIIGNKKTVAATTPETVRAYKDKWYRGGNVLIVLVGKLPKGERMELLENAFGGLPGGKLEQFVVPGAYGEERSFHLTKKTEQAHFAMAWPGHSLDNNDRYAAKVLATALGGSMSSRLFTEVREKRGLAYYVRAGHDPLYDVGQFVVKAGVKLEQLGEAKRVVMEQTATIGESVTESEVKLARDNLHGRTVLAMTDPMSVAQYYGHRTLLTDKVLGIDETLKALDKVTLSEVKRVAKELLRSELCRSVVVGPSFVG